MGILHIYPQSLWHNPAYVVGDRDGLTALRDAIDRALVSNQPSAAPVYCHDGEGYTVFVAPVGTLDNIALPYQDEVTAGSRSADDMTPGWRVIAPEDQRRIEREAWDAAQR
jgi:hypothetical protein